jgi:hypothetical protein
MSHLELVSPKLIPPLDEEFRPAKLANRNFQAQVKPVGVPLVIGLERSESEFSRYETSVYPEDHPNAAANFQYVERLVKFLLWQRGGFRVYIGGPQEIGEYVRQRYAADGKQ